MSFLIKSLREKIKNEKDGLQIKITRKDEKKSDFVVESTSSSSSSPPPPPLPEDNHHLLYNLSISKFVILSDISFFLNQASCK